MAYNDYDETQPVNIVAPNEFNIDPSTTRFAPMEYGGMAAQGLANWYGANVVPAIESLGESLTLARHGKVPPVQPEEDFSKPAKESVPLLQAIDSGYADPKIMNPVTEIREGAKVSDMSRVEKGYKKLVELFSDTGMTWGQRFADAYLRQGIGAQARQHASKLAADVTMSALMSGGQRAVEATSAGLMSPDELLPEQRMPVYQHLVPPQSLETGLGPEFGVENEPMSSIQPSLIPAQPGQFPATEIVDPKATLFPLQESLVESRIKAQASPRQPRQPRATTQADINESGIQTDLEVIRAREGREATPEEKSKIIAKWSGAEYKEGKLKIDEMLAESKLALNKAHENLYNSYGDRAKAEIELFAGRDLETRAKAALADARAAYIKQEPALRRELQGMKNASHPQHFVYQAIARVREALGKGETPNEVDSALFKSFVTKGSPEFRTTFLGDLYNAYTGQMVNPDLQNANKQGLLGVIKDYIGKLFGGEEPEDQVEEIDKDLPTPKSPEEAQKLKPGTRYKTPDGRVMVR